MLREAYGIKKLVIRTGRTDLRYGIDRLCSIVRTECGFNPREEGVLYIFCGTRNDRLKALVFEGDGFVLLTKRLLKGMEFKWPRSQTQALEIPAETYMELMNGCEVESSIPYSDVGSEMEAGLNMDASLGDIYELGAEVSVAAKPRDNKTTENRDLDGGDGLGQVTQDSVPLYKFMNECEKGLAEADGLKAAKADVEGCGSLSNSERASPRMA